MTKTKGKYGGRGRPWHPNFLKYIDFIATHSAYAGMPDAFVDGNRIQWEAPSNRTSGRFVQTHAKRREWWRKVAVRLGIDPNSNQWISRTAKQLHPTKRKPCKICGTELLIRYEYPQERLLKRLRRLPMIGAAHEFEPLIPIRVLITKLVHSYGKELLLQLPQILRTGSIEPPQLGNSLKAWLDWLDEVYIPQEPDILSPGVMSNAPDRFDGFHSDNLCCRSKADKGRSKLNLASYTTDRRVFEYWSSGDWVAADRLMGIIRSALASEACLNGHPGPCNADHIGPLSLGFSHRPEFQLLCGPCNGAKNNRMSLGDVRLLLAAEKRGEEVASWHSRFLWNAKKTDVTNNETALRLSKLLRDNRHTFTAVLQRIIIEGHLTFLVTLLELEYADHNVEFKNLRIERHVTVFDKMVRKARVTKYALEQKSRRCRVAFEALSDYLKKENRNAWIVSTPEIEESIGKILTALTKCPPSVKIIDQRLRRVLGVSEVQDHDLNAVVSDLPPSSVACFRHGKESFNATMRLVSMELVKAWNSDRYVRS